MSTPLRGRIAVLLLAGTYVIAAAQLGVLIVLVFALIAVLPKTAALTVAAPLHLATVGVLAYAMRFLRTRQRVVPGVPVTRTDAPELWAVLDELAAGTKASVPATVTVVAEACVSILERTRMLGLAAGPRELVLGLPVLQAFDATHVRALLAHEIAHGSRAAGRMAPIAWRASLAQDRAVARAGRRNPAAWAFRAWAGVCRSFAAPVIRAHELAADRYAAAVAGRRVTADVLRDLPVLEVAQQLFLAEYVGPGWQAGHVPDDLFEGFLRVLAARADDLAAWRATHDPDADRDPADPHPSFADRLAALTRIGAGEPPSGGAAPTVDDAPAAGQVAEIAGAPGAAAGGTDGGLRASGERAVEQDEDHGLSGGTTASTRELLPELPRLGRALQALVFPPLGRTTVGWDEFFGAARTGEMQREAGSALTALSGVLDTPVVDAAGVLELATGGSLIAATQRVFPELNEASAAARAAQLVKLLLGLAALHSGAARWRHSWTGTAELVTADGEMLDLGELAEVAIRADGAETLQRRLTELGIEPSAVTASGQDGRSEVVGGVVNVLADGARTDLLIVDTGFLLVPGVSRRLSATAKRRLVELAEADDAGRLDAVPGSRFVAYADVAGAEQTRRTPKTWRVALRDGSALVLRTSLDSDELPGGWDALDGAVEFLNRDR